MSSNRRSLRPFFVLGLAMASGAAIAAVDGFAFGGEISPIGIVALVLLATAAVGSLTTRRRWLGALAVWIWLPVVHLVNHVLGFPDTNQPNTYSSIFLLGAFSLAVAAVGTGFGWFVRRSVQTER